MRSSSRRVDLRVPRAGAAEEDQMSIGRYPRVVLVGIGVELIDRSGRAERIVRAGSDRTIDVMDARSPRRAVGAEQDLAVRGGQRWAALSKGRIDLDDRL